MLKKQLAINMIANVLAFLINVGISFIFTPYLINELGSEAYSFFPLANNFINYTSIITVALNSMASRFITIRIHEEDTKGASTYFNSVLLGNTIIAVMLSIPGIWIILNIEKILNVPLELIVQVKYLFGFVFLGLIINILGSVFGVATFAKNKIELSAIRSIQSKLIYVILLIGMFMLFQPSVVYIGICNLISIIYILVTNVYYTKKLLPEIELGRRFFDFKAIRELMSCGIWNTVNQLSKILLSGLDLLIVNIFIGASAAGEYAIVQTMPNLIQSLVGTLVGVFVPQFTILYAQKKHDELISSINSSIKIMGLFITLPIAFLIIFGDIFFSLWVPGENAQRLHILSLLLILPMIITGSINTIFNVYTVTNKLKVPAMVLLISGIIKSIFVFICLLTTNLGIFAIPLVSSIVDIITNLCFTPIYGAACLKIKWNAFYIAIVRGSVCSIVMMGLCYLLRSSWAIDTWIELFMAAGISTIVALMINVHIVFNKSERREFIIMIMQRMKN